MMTINRTKMVFIGDVNVGKSSLTYYMQHKQKAKNVGPTIAAAFMSIKREEFTFECWDSAGSERFKSLLPMYVRGSNVVVCVYDVTNMSSLEKVACDRDRYMKDIPSVVDSLWVLVGNKIDLKPYITTERVCEEADMLAKDWNVPHLFASAETGEGVEELFDRIILELRGCKMIERDPNIIKVGQDNKTNDTSLQSTNGGYGERIMAVKTGCCS